MHGKCNLFLSPSEIIFRNPGHRKGDACKISYKVKSMGCNIEITGIPYKNITCSYEIKYW